MFWQCLEFMVKVKNRTSSAQVHVIISKDYGLMMSIRAKAKCTVSCFHGELVSSIPNSPTERVLSPILSLYSIPPFL
jgi:hypothetical protein